MAKKSKLSKLGDILKKFTKKSMEAEIKKEKAKSYDIRKIFQDMELNLISSMKKAFYFHEREQQKEGFQWEQWQLTKLRELEKYRKRNKDLVDSYSDPIQEAIDREIDGNYKKGQNRVKKLIKKAVDKAKELLPRDKVPSIDLPSDIEDEQSLKDYISKLLKRPIKPPEETNFFGVNDKKLNALQETVTKDLKNANHAVLRKMDDIYRQVLYKAQVNMQAGAKTLNQAIDMATKDFLDKGISCIRYKDGKMVNITSYAEMALRTASHRATLLGEGKKRDEYGLYLVVVSAHANTCKKCLPWQGKVIIDDVFSHPSKEFIEENKQYPLLSEAIEKGLLHPNCRHTLTTYFPGITKLPVVPDEEEALKNYEAEQRQRALERELRKWKRVKAGACDVENQEKATVKVKELEDKLRQHLKDNPQLRRDYDREQIQLSVKEKKVIANYDNGLDNKNEFISIPKETVIHANEGEFTNPKNPKKIKSGEIRLKSGGHGQDGMELLNSKEIEYNIVKEYDNGVRIGNVPKHRVKAKQSGTGQAWFPKSWDSNDIEIAAKYVGNLKDKNKYLLQHNKDEDGNIISIFKYANHSGVTVGICYDCKKRKITTIFPDEKQRMLGGESSE
ncbi:phage minor capsid protein [Hathewaya massiliensis]|uniref:phage minor capsid protein n=1 Tax=Hathewaya massiliensis TaxID=1964382 RepID=UPI001157BC4E|nr:phage minor capsid protein [Hathewaya massiliensis]